MTPSPTGARFTSPRIHRSDDTYHVIGVGFGVSGLALAAALHEKGGADNALFLERKQAFGWHAGMLIEGSSMQVSFLKDLVTMRNPQSEFSFLAYLHEKGRLVSFINHGILMPSRREFHDYLGWVANQLGHLVRYGVPVSGVIPIVEDGAVRALGVVADGNIVARAKNIVVGTGLQPRLPKGINTSERLWHSSELMYRLVEFDAHPPNRVIVVGAGQSAAEVALHLMHRYPSAEVCPVFTRYGYSTADTNPFANRIFDPSAVDDFYSAPPHIKQSLIEYHRNTNYSVADGDVLDDLYRLQYEQSVTGPSQLRIFNASRVVDVELIQEGVSVEIEFLPSGERSNLTASLVIYATGYEPADPKDLLHDMANHLETDESGELLIDRNYRLVTRGEFHCGVYVQGATEASHGIASTLLSVAAVRAEEISLALALDGQAPRSSSPKWA